MSTPAVTITSMTMVEAEPRGDGSRLVATFDCDLPPVRLVGCLVLETADGDLRAYPPEARSRTKDERAVTITDARLRHLMQRKAVALYEAMLDEAEED